MSDAIVCTAFIASATSIRENVNSTAILVDEAARLTEPELWPVLGGWYRPKALILVGDHHHTQLSHHTLTPRRGIPLLYLEVSTECQGSRRRYAVHARLRHDGHRSMFQAVRIIDSNDRSQTKWIRNGACFASVLIVPDLSEQQTMAMPSVWNIANEARQNHLILDRDGSLSRPLPPYGVLEVFH